MGDAWLVVGLGNLGTRYARGRHNVGYVMLDVLAECTGSRFSQHKKTRTRVAEDRLGIMSGRVPGPRVILAEPSVLMNPSGDPMARLVSYYGVDPASRLLVIHGKLDLPAHELRLKRGGGEGGHNGLCSISKSAPTKDYAHLRIGIGHPPGRQDPSDFVLSNFPGRGRTDLGVTLEQAVNTIEQIVTVSFSGAQQCLHTPR